ncbi:MAG: hypothetical protein NZM31_07490 [Gemmatales bacterium]|nr:hypothetical protein [Gemmatales bacterium]MDW8386838.1 hypothetical protein [Gemmatales bacterium]
MASEGLHAPQDHGAILCVPPLDAAEQLLTANHRLFRSADVRILDQPLPVFREQARQGALRLADEFARACGFSGPLTGSGLLIMTGHQPELFHPGVWLKNFAVHQLARRLGGVGCNLLVDNDIVVSPAIKVPVRLSGRPVALPVLFDRPRLPIPWEEWKVVEEERFASLPKTVAEITSDWPFRPVLGDFWVLLGHGPLLGERFAAGRHRLEERWGCRNWELPLGRLCDQAAFQQFFLHIVLNLPHFWEAYNQALTEYRRRRRLKSIRHPIPNLDRQGDWLEAPFWIWSGAQPQRQRLYVLRQGDAIRLGIGTQTVATLSASQAGKWDQCPVWKDLAERGWKVRSRALTTTLFVRLCLADLFIHGIGGAIYDEITDGIMRRFFGLEPPGFFTVTGTLRLPFAACRDSRSQDASVAELRQRLRDLRYKPERWLGNDFRQEVRQLVEIKRRLVAEQPADPDARRRRWRTLQTITEELSDFLGGEIEQVKGQLRQTEEASQELAVLCSREYAFCLHPEAELRSWLTAPL